MREASCSCEAITGRPMDYDLVGEARIGDHRWWVSDLAGFQPDYPEWELTDGDRATSSRRSTPSTPRPGPPRPFADPL